MVKILKLDIAHTYIQASISDSLLKYQSIHVHQTILKRRTDGNKLIRKGVIGQDNSAHSQREVKFTMFTSR